MNVTDKKYQLLTTIGGTLILLVILFGKYLKDDTLHGLIFGFAVGWLCATWLLKLLIVREQGHKAKLESKKVLQEMKEEFKI